MNVAYTPGLQLREQTRIERIRRLPIAGSIRCEAGDTVEPGTVVAAAEIAGIMSIVHVANKMSTRPEEIGRVLAVGVGEHVSQGQVLASSKSLFGLLTTTCVSPVSGTIETISDITGNIGVRRDAAEICLTAYISGKVARLIGTEGVVIETVGALVQGIFGVGGERSGRVLMAVDQPDSVLHEADVLPTHAGAVLIGGALVTGQALRRAADVGVAAIVVGGIIDADLVAYLGHDIGIAITGHEAVVTSVVVTEGFGQIPMARRTFDLLKRLAGQTASVNGATQIRAGVIRPEVIIPCIESATADPHSDGNPEVMPGSFVRVVRDPYFGIHATVISMPSNPEMIESGVVTRVLRLKLVDGRIVSVPRANIESLSGS